MKNIIKKTGVLMALALLVTSLASCEKNVSTSGDTVEIKIVTSERSKMELYQAAAEKFNAENDKNIPFTSLQNTRFRSIIRRLSQ